MKVVYDDKDWCVGIASDGHPVCFGPGGVALTVDDAQVRLTHDVASFEFVGGLVSEDVVLPVPFVVAALRAHGFIVEPPTDAA